MNPFQLAIDATFDRLGVEAVIEQASLQRIVKIMPFEDDDFGDFGETRVKASGGTYEIRATEFEGFSKGAVLTVGAKRRKVQGIDCKDSRRLKRILRTVPA